MRSHRSTGARSSRQRPCRCSARVRSASFSAANAAIRSPVGSCSQTLVTRPEHQHECGGRHQWVSARMCQRFNHRCVLRNLGRAFDAVPMTASLGTIMGRLCSCGCVHDGAGRPPCRIFDAHRCAGICVPQGHRAGCLRSSHRFNRSVDGGTRCLQLLGDVATVLPKHARRRLPARPGAWGRLLCDACVGEIHSSIGYAVEHATRHHTLPSLRRGATLRRVKACATGFFASHQLVATSIIISVDVCCLSAHAGRTEIGIAAMPVPPLPLTHWRCMRRFRVCRRPRAQVRPLQCWLRGCHRRSHHRPRAPPAAGAWR